MKKIILVGGGGHCRSVIDVLEAEGKFQIAGIVDVKAKLGTKVSGYKIIATDAELPKLVRSCKYFCITVGQLESATLRENIYKKLKKYKVQLPVIVSPMAYVSKSAKIGEGTVVMHGAIVNTGVVIGNNVIVNTMSLIEHDTKVGDHCHISTKAVLNGEVVLGDNVFVGSNAVVINNIKIAGNTVIGAGTVVHKSILKKGKYAGNPARHIGG